jgi:hypothetical protein
MQGVWGCRVDRPLPALRRRLSSPLLCQFLGAPLEPGLQVGVYCRDVEALEIEVLAQLLPVAVVLVILGIGSGPQRAGLVPMTAAASPSATCRSRERTTTFSEDLRDNLRSCLRDRQDQGGAA